MTKRLMTLALGGLVLNLSFFNSTASANSKEEKFAAKVKAAVLRLGVGRDARVKVKMRDNTKIKGYISEVREGGFVIVDDKSNLAVEVPYSMAKQVQGNNLSTGEKIALGVAVILVLVLAAYSI